MSKLYVTEYQYIGKDDYNNPVYAGREPAITTQVLDFSGGAVASAAFNADTSFIRIAADAACHIEFADSPTATTSDQAVWANQYEYKAVVPGQKISVIGA